MVYLSLFSRRKSRSSANLAIIWEAFSISQFRHSLGATTRCETDSNSEYRLVTDLVLTVA